MGRVQTRWEEAISRMKSLIEILAYVPTPPIFIRFLNREAYVNVHHNGQTPEAFIDEITKKLDAATAAIPTFRDTTPVEQVLAESFRHWQGKRVARYIFGDGEPNGGEAAQKRIKDMVVNRADKQGNPVSFFSCTDNDDQVEWMKETEEVALFCGEYDDYNDEAQEVLRDQGMHINIEFYSFNFNICILIFYKGVALPFNPGFYLAASLIGAMNPDDIDVIKQLVNC